MLLADGGAQNAAQGVLLGIGILLIVLMFGGLLFWFIGNIVEDPGGAFTGLLVCVTVPVVLVGLVGTAITGNLKGSAIVGLVIGLIWWVISVFDA